MDTKVKVPNFMLKAALDVKEMPYTSPFVETVRPALEAALRALMENPIVPDEAQRANLSYEWNNSAIRVPSDYATYAITWWISRMFLSPTNPRRDKIRRILHTFGILSEDEKIDAILSAFEEGAEK